MDPDPAIFVLDLQHANKKFFLQFFWLLRYFLKVRLRHFSKIKVIKKSQNSRNQCFSYYFCLMIEKDPDPYLWLTDQVPRGPKTYEFYRSGSTTLVRRCQTKKRKWKTVRNQRPKIIKRTVLRIGIEPINQFPASALISLDCLTLISIKPNDNLSLSLSRMATTVSKLY